MDTELTERQKEIINASLELIDESGIQSLTIKNISKKVGLVESAIYRHYRSKTQILIALLDTICEQTGYRNETEVASVFEFIEKKLANHFQTFQKNPALVSVVFAEDLFQNVPELVVKTRLQMERSLSALSELIQQGQRQGEIRSDIDPGIISVMINGSLRMLVKQWRMSAYSFNLTSRGKKLIASYKLMLK
ncbi:MAG: TetR/AcrR family transcriptional regulator [Bacteroidales bacterium]|nr:TetR/AcrR family transcriptional regulator [Bacteroidales bacterium]